MSDELPEGWASVKLPAIATLNMGQSPPSDTYNTGGKGLPFFQGKAEFGDLYPKPVKYCSRPSKIAESGDILISVRAPVGPTNLCLQESCIGRGLAAIRPLEKIPSLYLLYYLRSIEEWLSRQGTGSTFTAISKKDLEQLIVRLAPLTEQHRIVAKLEKLLGKVDACHKRLAKIPVLLKRFRQSVLAAACSGQLTADWREHNHDSIGLTFMMLSEVAGRIQIGPFGTQLHRADYIPNGIPLINPTHIQDSKIIHDPNFSVPREKYKELGNYVLQENDIIMGRRGEMGRCALVSKKESGWLCGTGSLFVRPKSSIQPEFLFLNLRNGETKAFLESESKGTTMSNLNLEILKRVPVSVPPLAEQQEIIQRVEKLFDLADRIEARYAKANSHLGNLKPSLLAKTFRGDLVRTEAEVAEEEGRDYEPATVLLERIHSGNSLRHKTRKRK